MTIRRPWRLCWLLSWFLLRFLSGCWTSPHKMLQRHGKQACVFSYTFVMSFRRSSQACPSLLCSSHSFCLSMSCPSPVLCVLHACSSIYPSFAFLFCNLFIICAFSLASLLCLLLACLLACLPACLFYALCAFISFCQSFWLFNSCSPF